MASRSRLAKVLLAIYTVVNVGGLIYAAVMREPMHAALHAALLVPVAWLLSRRMVGSPGSSTPLASSGAVFPGRLTNLEQSIDAVAIEIERIAEGQRNLTDLLADQEPRGVQRKEAAPSAIPGKRPLS
jgi:hypothetical protein